MTREELMIKMNLFLELVKDLDKDRVLVENPVYQIEEKLTEIMEMLKGDIKKLEVFNEETKKSQEEFGELVDLLENMVKGSESIQNIEAKKDKILKHTKASLEEAADNIEIKKREYE